MKRAYIETDRKFDRDEDGNPEPPVKWTHDCLDHLDSKEAEWTEEHGERCRQEWWQCTVCLERFTDSEVEQMMNPQPQKKQPAMQGNLFHGNEGVA